MGPEISIKLRKLPQGCNVFLAGFGLFKCLFCFPCVYPLKSQDLGLAELEWQWDVEGSGPHRKRSDIFLENCILEELPRELPPPVLLCLDKLTGPGTSLPRMC